MKKYVLLLFVLMLLPMVASAFDIAVRNADEVTIYYNYINNGTELEVTKGWSDYRGSINIPGSVKYRSQTLSVTSIGREAFQGCTGLTSVTISNSMTSIERYTFYKCTGLTSVTIPNSVTNIGYGAFSGCSSLTSIAIPNSVTSIENYTFYGCSSLTFVTIPNSVTSIGRNAFYYCSSLTSIAIPNSVTSIDVSAFSYCSSLSSVTIPNSVTSIGPQAFSYCSSLTSITIPNSVTSIWDRAFSGCSSLTSITIGSGITSIEVSAFANCPELTDVTCMAESVPSTGSNAFADSPINNATLHVPNTSLETYKNTTPWSEFGKIVPLESSGVEAIDSNGATISNYFTLDGQCIELPRKGVYIMRMDDGTVKKVMIKR